MVDHNVPSMETMSKCVSIALSASGPGPVQLRADNPSHETVINGVALSSGMMTPFDNEAIPSWPASSVRTESLALGTTPPPSIHSTPSGVATAHAHVPISNSSKYEPPLTSIAVHLRGVGGEIP